MTGAWVTVWMARSATETPRKIQTSPVRVCPTASSRESTGTGRYVTDVRLWKLLGLAGLAGAWVNELQLSQLAPLLAAHLGIRVG